MIKPTLDRITHIKGTCYLHKAKWGFTISGDKLPWYDNASKTEGEKQEGVVFEAELIAANSSQWYGQETGKVKFTDPDVDKIYYSMNTDDLIELMYSKDVELLGNGRLKLKFIVSNRWSTMFIRPFSERMKEDEEKYIKEQARKKAIKKNDMTTDYGKWAIINTSEDNDSYSDLVYLGYGSVELVYPKSVLISGTHPLHRYETRPTKVEMPPYHWYAKKNTYDGKTTYTLEKAILKKTKAHVKTQVNDNLKNTIADEMPGANIKFWYYTSAIEKNMEKIIGEGGIAVYSYWNNSNSRDLYEKYMEVGEIDKLS